MKSTDVCKISSAALKEGRSLTHAKPEQCLRHMSTLPYHILSVRETSWLPDNLYVKDSGKESADKSYSEEVRQCNRGGYAILQTDAYTPHLLAKDRHLPYHRTFYEKDQMVHVKQNKLFRLVKYYTSSFMPNSHPLVPPKYSPLPHPTFHPASRPPERLHVQGSGEPKETNQTAKKHETKHTTKHRHHQRCIPRAEEGNLHS
jgi:hypothetical protein